MQRVGSVCSIWMATGAVLAAALLGIAGAANASATIDLIWADTGTNEIANLSSSSVITLQVILTAGPDGSQGAGVSIDYSDAMSTLSVIGYASTAAGPLPVTLGVTTDTGSRVENINSGALPPYVGSGLTAEGQSHQLGTVTFQLIQPVAGTLEIRSDANSPTDGVLNLGGDNITSITTFNSAFICSGTGPCTTPGATPTPTATPTTGATPTATATPTTSATPTATAIPTPTATATASPTPTNSPTPTAEPSPTPSATPTAPPLSCSEIWPEITFVTLGKGQSPSNNPKLTHSIRAHIIDPSSLRETAHRIPVCAGTEVAVAIADTTGTPTNTALGSLSCSSSGCAGMVNETEKYNSTSADGKDKDSITFLPK